MISFEAPDTLAEVVVGIPKDCFNDLLASPETSYLVSIQTVSPDEMATLNQQYRGIDKPTDVLSFPLFADAHELPTHDAPLGDLFICLEAVDEAHLGLRECILHGTLHLLGYDHETDEPAWDNARRRLHL